MDWQAAISYGGEGDGVAPGAARSVSLAEVNARSRLRRFPLLVRLVMDSGSSRTKAAADLPQWLSSTPTFPHLVTPGAVGVCVLP
jgi:hypothetical protein